jgi:hypothetical protein
MERSTKKNVIPQMFDVRPIGRTGGLDWERIRSVGDASALSVKPDTSEVEFGKSDADAAERIPEPTDPSAAVLSECHDIPSGPRGMFPSRTLVAAAFLVLFLVGGVWGSIRVLSLKSAVLGESFAGLSSADLALRELSSARFGSSADHFSDAYDSFSEASGAIGVVGNELAKATRIIPGLSIFSSGQGIVEGAKHLSSAGVSMSRMLALLPISSGEHSGVTGDASLLELLSEAERLAESAQGDLSLAEASLSRVDVDDIPEEKRQMFLSLRDNLPLAEALLSGFDRHALLIRELLGENGPRVYLLLFQNNHELRPTGGFIGSYGVVGMDRGHVRKFLIDGIFNPAGQFKENIVPPAPIRKVSAGWSLHDSNWWPDFPTSAEKAMLFYEKTGGPTVDGIMTLTPAVIERLLLVTGPIPMPEYGVTIDSENFMAAVQEEVEVKYDRELNQPKRIIADLAPLLLDRLFQSKDPAIVLAAAETLSRGLNERHILLYSRNTEAQRLLDDAGWSGRLLPTPKDYLSVVHTNLNGYKTDGVIDEEVEHQAKIQADGSIIDTVRITRTHRGGNTPFEWWNKVNSDYLRVYVPEGSELLSARGHTYEFPDDPLDYDALGFRRDPDVEREEEGTTIHESGTRISREAGKTVFGNWVYVSPGESVTVEYSYRLPFRILPDNTTPASYSALFQKQAGTPGSALRHALSFPDTFVPVWNTPESRHARQELVSEATLSTDAFFGAVFMKR